MLEQSCTAGSPGATQAHSKIVTSEIVALDKASEQQHPYKIQIPLSMTQVD